MSPAVGERVAERLLTFEVGGSVYALPIEGVLEVAERGRITCVPTLPQKCGGVMNWHGDALPVVYPEHVLECETTGEEGGGEHLLVVSERGGASARLGLPIDKVVGLVECGGHQGAPQGGLIVERRPVEGRVVNVLDPRALLARARQVIEGVAHS